VGHESEDTAGARVRFVDDVRRIWDAKAAFWDERMGDGNDFQLVLIGPAVERLLDVKPGERVLDVACGNGVTSRRLAQLGAQVVAVDYSAELLARARARSSPSDRIDYRLVDATDESQLLALGEGAFAALLCNMAIMDMPAIDPLMRAAARLLAPGGRLVFSVQHPAFNSNAVSLCAETHLRDDGREVMSHAVRISDYLNVPPGKGTAMLGEPEPHWYFQRPLQELFGACFQAGFVLDGLEEPAFPFQEADSRAVSWRNLPGIPPVLVARVVRRGDVGSLAPQEG
jgi:2-polyprenyl-3-methyl-5-hydroxy-6-metoxy-1,4-benzoquinol methylase